MATEIRWKSIFLALLYALSFIPTNASAQVSDYDVCNNSYTPLRTKSTTVYFNTLECDYTAVGDYEKWEDYTVERISSSDYFHYYIYINDDNIGSYLWLKLSEYSDDLDGVGFDVDLELYGPDGGLIEGSYGGEDVAEYMSATLVETGYYKIKVIRFDGAGDFKLERELTENRGPTGSLNMGAPAESLFMHEQIYFDACESYDVGGGAVYFDWFIDETLQSSSLCDLTVFIHDKEFHKICVTVSDYYDKGFTNCETIKATDPFSSTTEAWESSKIIDFDSRNSISIWDKSDVYKAPGLDFWFKLGIRNDYKVATDGSWEIKTDTRWGDDEISTTFSIQNVDTTHQIFLRPSLTFEYYSKNMNEWQTLDIPMMSSVQVYSGQPSIDVFGVDLYYWNDFVSISDNALYFEDYPYSNSFVLGDFLTLSEVDLYPLVRELLDYGTQGVSGASEFLDFMEDWSEIRIPLSYDLEIGIAGIEYTGLMLNPIEHNKVVKIEEKTNKGWGEYVESDGIHIGNQIEIYELGLTDISLNSDLAEIGDLMPSIVVISSVEDSGTDQVDYQIMQYSDIIIYNYQTPSINIGIESSFGNNYWTIAEFAESESLVLSRTVSDTNMLLSAIRDSDGDGVKNSNDDCAKTPREIGVLNDGCPDSLLDRVLTRQGNMVPIYGISGGVFLVLFIMVIMTFRSGKKGMQRSSSNLNLGFEQTYSPDSNPVPAYYPPPPIYNSQNENYLHNQDPIESIPDKFDSYLTIDKPTEFSDDGFWMLTETNGWQPTEKQSDALAKGATSHDHISESEMLTTNVNPVPSFDQMGEVGSDGYEWLEYNETWWWRNSPTNHWAIYNE